MAMASFANVPTVSLRRALGIRARRPSAYASCIGARLRGGKHPSAPPGAGGRRNVGWQNAFVQAGQGCRGATRGARRGAAAA